MRASAQISVGRRGDRSELVDRRSPAPFSVRRCGARILLASSAAMPVGGDVLGLDIDVGSRARADVGSVAASMVWPGPDGEPSTMRTCADVADGAHLDLWLEPTVSVQGSHHRTCTVVRLAGSASCRVVEEVVLGRTGELSGILVQTLRVERNARALAHHVESFGPTVPGAGSSVSVGSGRHALAAVLVGVDAGAPRSCVQPDGRAAAWLPLAPDAAMVLGLGAHRPEVIDLLREVTPELFAPAVVDRDDR